MSSAYRDRHTSFDVYNINLYGHTWDICIDVHIVLVLPRTPCHQHPAGQGSWAKAPTHII